VEFLERLLDLALLVAGIIGMGAVVVVFVGSIIAAFSD
jgi:hypothetical protein